MLGAPQRVKDYLYRQDLGKLLSREAINSQFLVDLAIVFSSLKCYETLFPLLRKSVEEYFTEAYLPAITELIAEEFNITIIVNNQFEMIETQVGLAKRIDTGIVEIEIELGITHTEKYYSYDRNIIVTHTNVLMGIILAVMEYIKIDGKKQIFKV